MLKQPVRFAVIVIFVLVLTTLSVGPASAANGPAPTPPPPPPGMTVDQKSISAAAISAPPVRLTVQQSKKLDQLKNAVTTLSETVVASAAATADINFNFKTNFPLSTAIRYVGWVNNNTGSSQTFYAWWYLSNPCGPSSLMWNGWLTAPTGQPGWFINSTTACAGANLFTFWVWYNGVYTSRSVSFTVGGSTPVTYSINSNLTNRAYVSSLTGANIDFAMRAMRSTNNGLIGYGQTFADVGSDLGLNPLFIAALTAWQTGWGTSALWVYKNNPFSYGRYGRCSYSCALTFSSKAQGIRTGMTYIKRDYLVPGGPYYYNQYGPTLRGMNINFAADPNWKYGIASIMTTLAAKLHLTK